MRHPADGFNGFINGVEKPSRGFQRILPQVIPELPDDVSSFAAGLMVCFTTSSSGPCVFWRGPRPQFSGPSTKRALTECHRRPWPVLREAELPAAPPLLAPAHPGAASGNTR